MGLKNKFRVGYWNIGFIENSIEEIIERKSYHIRWVRHNYKDRFFADPFIYRSDDINYYILAEELIFIQKKGRIVLLTIDKKTMTLIDRKLVIEDEAHLSYPNYEDGIVVAENYKSGGLYSFYIEETPIRKELITEIPLIDPTFVDHNGKRWLFATTRENADDPNKKLSIYVEKNGKFVPHKKNPVKIDIHSGRPGGKFFHYKGSLYRPAQNCEHIYGEDVKIMKILRLDEEDFIEEEFMTISSHHLDRYNLGLHTFNIGNGFVVVDGFEYSTQIVQKIKNKLAGC